MMSVWLCAICEYALTSCKYAAVAAETEFVDKSGLWFEHVDVQ